MEDPEEIRRENFCTTLRIYFFPFYRLYSATTIIVLLHIAFFVLVLIIHGLLPSYTFLKISIPVRELYSRHPYYIQRKFELWRFLTCVFLHESFTSLFLAIILNILLISLLENMVKGTRTFFFYFGTSILGNLFGVVCTDKKALGLNLEIIQELLCLCTGLLVD